jgi:hypothetical protein
LMAVCSGIKRDGGRCTATVEPPQGYCWWHDPANADKRKRAASRGGSSRGGSELADLKKQIRGLAAAVLDGTADRGRAAVANQLYNTLVRAIEQERKIRETGELAERLEAMEQVLKGRRTG